jgi:8-oxo-dGTP pyrophosphatase MutT (NUDIX family)
MGATVFTLRVNAYASRQSVLLARSFSGLVDDLTIALAKPLPAGDAHVLMAPRPRRQWPDGFGPHNARHAAGLLLTFPFAGRAHIVLTQRADTLGRHGGQISLPGGVIEPGEAFEHAALREAHEEIAVNPADVRVLGGLTPIDIPVSGFRLHPVVGVSERRPDFAAADGEVARVVDVAVEDLMAPEAMVLATRKRDGHEIAVPAFSVAGVEIWGATAMILAEFLVVLGWIPRDS